MKSQGLEWDGTERNEIIRSWLVRDGASEISDEMKSGSR